MKRSHDVSRSRRGVRVWVGVALLVLSLAALAYSRGGLLGLPPAPSKVTSEEAGLAGLREMAKREQQLEAASVNVARVPGIRVDADSALARTAEGLARVRRGDVQGGLEAMRKGLALDPSDLVLGNAYRLTVFGLRRAALTDRSRAESLAPQFPAALAHEPIASLERLRREHPSREATMQLALAWVDEMLLFPALEIKAPASVESVNLFSEILQRDPSYVPALYGRGLNYLHRPSRLVWPESRKAAPDAASRDLSLCVAIGRKVGVGSPDLVATLALTLGDCYAKEGQPQRARSWWQVAENATADRALREAVARRFTFQDDDMVERLEAELEARMLDLDHPLTDLSVMWRQRRS